MILERFPELATLDAEQRLILAAELWRSATTTDGSTRELPPEEIRLLEERLAHFEANPNSGVSWEELRDQKNAG